jgi:hypothetical protein
MAIIASYPLRDSFAGVYQLQAMNTFPIGDASPDGIGNSLKIVNGWMVSTITDTDPLTATGQRAEIQAAPDPNAERWYSWKMMIPLDWIDSADMTLMQIHDSPDNGDPARSPNFVLSTWGGLLKYTIPAAELPAENNNGSTFSAGPLVKGHVYECCLHVNWQPNGFGFRELFIDKVPIFRQYNIGTHYVDVVGPYFKLGVYNHGHVAGFGIRTAYYRDVVIRSGNDGYQSVLGGLPTAEEIMTFSL